MENYLNLFLTQVRIKGSEKTAKDYQQYIQRFLGKCQKALQDIQYVDLLQYYDTEFSGLSTNSKRTYMSGVLSYFRFLYEQDIISKDITKGFVLPKPELKDMEYLTEEEAKKVASVCNLESRNPLRKRAMFIMFINTGMRASELANLKLTDIAEDKIMVRHAKGNKFRTIPIHPSVREAINEYIRKERRSASPYLFVNQCGCQLSHININRDLERITAKSGIDKHITAHRLRDSFATIQYLNGSDLKSVQETLGHENLQMTMHYVQKVDERRTQQILSSGVQF